MSEEWDFDFSGDSYETTQFNDDGFVLQTNLDVTESFLSKLGTPLRSEVAASAYVWFGIDCGTIFEGFVDKYKISSCSSLYKDIPIFEAWIKAMNIDGKYLKWNVAIAGDSTSETIWHVGSCRVGKISRSKKKDKEFIDIGSLRSGRDAVCDVVPSALNPEELRAFNKSRKNGRNIISARSLFGLEDIPLLLLYCVDKDQGIESKTRSKINSSQDIIGFSIIVSGENTSGSHAKTLTVRFPTE
ncbi:hypothetical protein SDC9_120001 [bioreactor metagenome]|uniref:Uncharacterized protein n=1 Tax=bioreactor metagenome TaxID=1076179 RepID=A0A645C636_9ZZZZ